MSQRLHSLIDKKNGKSSKAVLILFVYMYVCLPSVLDLNAFERQNKAEGLGMAMDESSGTVFIWK